jgi:hypothetical protein
MGGFLSGIFGGSSPGLSTATSNLGSLAGFTGNVGEQGTNAGLNYNLGILSGDPSKIAQVEAPEISQAQNQAQQNKNTVAQFGNRGGGMNSVMAGLDDATRAKLINLTGQLQQGAAQNASQIGSTNTGQATSNNLGAGQLSQQQLMDMMNSILGKGISSGVSSLESAGLGAIGA